MFASVVAFAINANVFYFRCKVRSERVRPLKSDNHLHFLGNFSFSMVCNDLEKKRKNVVVDFFMTIACRKSHKKE
jgi:hypothetical protein